MEELKRDLQESIVLHNVFISILSKMRREDDKEFFKFVRNFTRTNYTAVANAIIDEVKVNLIKEIFVLINQMWAENTNRFDESLIKQKTLYQAIKNKISNNEKFPFNNRQLYKKIRECIAHNSENIQNFVFNLEDFELNLGKVDGKDYIIHLNFLELIDLLHILHSNFKSVNDPTRIIIDCENELKTREQIAEKIKIVNIENQTVKDLDKNQVERFYNYFKYVEPNQNLEGNEKELQLVFAFQNNAERLLLEKMRALSMLSKMNSSSSLKDIEEERNFDKINVYYAIVSNLFFTIAASRNNEELEQLFSGCVSGFEKDKIRHFRNALCHGRYFHDFFKTFYFYDGKKELNFELSLTIQDINKILDKIAKGGFSVVALN